VRLFLDTSVLLAAAGSAGGASRFVVTGAAAQGWALVTADYCGEKVRRNLSKLVSSAPGSWQRIISPTLEVTPVRLTLDRPLVFPKAKDRPVVISALAARCAWLLTLDETDFHGNLGREIYGMRIATPGQFLIEQRQAGLL
jgi:hypothetical protein